MTMKELFSEWQDQKSLLIACIILDVAMIGLGKSLPIAISGLLMLLCLILALRITYKNK